MDDYVKGICFLVICTFLYFPIRVINRLKRNVLKKKKVDKKCEDEKMNEESFDEICNQMMQKKHISDGKDKDLLNRQSTVNKICEMVDDKIASKEYCTIALDGKWGIGKSFILKKVKEKLKNKYMVFDYNCWKNDFYEEPLYGILYSIALSLNDVERDNPDLCQEKYYKAMRAVFFNIASFALKPYFDLDDAKERVHNIKEEYTKDKIVFQDERFCLNLHEVLDQVNTLLTNYLAYESRKIVILVDELDRCLPNYAIKVLNRLHHICYGSSIVLVMAVNYEELYPNINMAFGRTISDEGFAKRYLRRFIDNSFNLSLGLANELLQLWGDFVNKFDDSIPKEFFDTFCRSILWELPMRDIKKAIFQIKSLHNIAYEQCKGSKELSLAIVCAEIIVYISKKYHDNGNIVFVMGPFQSGPVDENSVDEYGNPEFKTNTFSITDNEKKKFGFCVEELITEYDGDNRPYEISLDCPENKIKALFADITYPPEAGRNDIFVCNSNDELYKAEKEVFEKFKESI